MIEIQPEQDERRQMEGMGEGWIRAITEGAPERIEAFCQPQIVSFVLTPKRYMTLQDAGGLSSKYRDWFGTCTDFQLVAKRIGWVGERLAIFYSFLLQDDGDWYRIEQPVYCTLRDSRVERLHLLCSGFQLVGAEEPPARAHGPQAKR